VIQTYAAFPDRILLRLEHVKLPRYRHFQYSYSRWNQLQVFPLFRRDVTAVTLWVGMLTWLRAGRPKNRGTIHSTNKRLSVLHNAKTGLESHPVSYWKDTRASSSG